MAHPPSLKISELPWKNGFVEAMPGDPELRNFTRQVPQQTFSPVQPTPVAAPKLIGWSSELATELGLQKPEGADVASLEILSGNLILPSMRPYAARYGGHQFGNWAGQLGDGRAITLGEVEFPSAPKLEFQLKGAGPTPYSRRADGRAVLRSSVREFLCSEAMHFLGVPTTRALSLVTTGDAVVRDLFYDGNARPEPGAIVCRVSPSFLRFGNFEIHAAEGETEILRKLITHTIRAHYPAIDATGRDAPGQLLDEVARRTARMVAHWMRVGFVHGVMNTDNFSILGLTIDYGPYGWLEPFDPQWTPNTTDAQSRRYRYGNQPSIAFWNLARLCEAFHPIIDHAPRLENALVIFRETFAQEFGAMLAAKLGLANVSADDDQKLAEEIFALLQTEEIDFTRFFRGLSDWDLTLDSFSAAVIAPARYATSPMPADFAVRWLSWSKRYRERRLADPLPPTEQRARMRGANPKYVLRNYLAQNAITAAEAGDSSVMERLLRVLRNPYADQPGEDDLAEKRPEWARDAPGCSALSCSS